MIPQRLTLSGFLSYRNETTFDFTANPVWILSGHNGAGKSAIFDAMLFALYGDAHNSIRPDIINKHTDKTVVTFEFSAGGKDYRIQRAKTRGSTSKPAIYESGSSVPIIGSTAVSTCNDLVRQIIGLDSDAFTTTVCLRQGQAERLLEQIAVNNQGANKALELLKQVVSLEPYEKISTEAEQKCDEYRRKYARQEADFNDLEVITEDMLQSAAAAILTAQADEDVAESRLTGLIEDTVHAQHWESWSNQKAVLESELAIADTLLKDQSAIEAAHARHLELAKLVPLRQEEISAIVAVAEAEQKYNEISDSLGLLPPVTELDQKIQRCQEASGVLVTFEHLARIENSRKGLLQKRGEFSASMITLIESPDLIERRDLARSAAKYLPYLQQIQACEARVQSGKSEKSHFETQLHDLIRGMEEAEKAVDSTIKEEASATTSRERAALTKNNCEGEYDRKKAERLKLETTRDSRVCGYCGQLLTQEQWESNYETALSAERVAEAQKSQAIKEWEISEAALKIAKTARANADNQSRLAIITVSNLQASIVATEKAIQIAHQDVEKAKQGIDSSFTLSLEESEKHAESLSNLEEAIQWVASMAEADRQYADFYNSLSLSAREWELIDVKTYITAGQVAEKQKNERIRIEAQLPQCAQILAERQLRLQGLVSKLTDEQRRIPLDDLLREQQRLLGIDERLQALNTARADATKLQTKIEQLASEIETIPERARRSIKLIQMEKTDAERSRDLARKNHDITREHQGNLQQQAEKYTRAKRELDATHTEAQLWKEIEKLLGKNTLQAWLMDQAQGEIVDFANEALDRFSQNRLRLDFADSRHQTALNLVCYDTYAGGEPLALGNLSGSQRFRVAVCLALGIGRFAAKDSRKIQSVIIDEGFGSLDPDALREVSKELQTLNESLGLERVIVVSHQETFADAFSHRYRIKMTEATGSFIDV